MLPIDKIPPLTNIRPTERVTPLGNENAKVQPKADAFQSVFEQAVTEKSTLNFSSHAQQRLLTRQIQLTPQQIDRLKTGVDQAAQKGAKDSLVMMDNLAFIVSISNKTVVTALDGAAKNGNVFTKIDSAVIV